METHTFELATATGAPAGSVRAGSAYEALRERRADLREALRRRYVHAQTRARHMDLHGAVTATHSDICPCRSVDAGMTAADLYA